MGELIGTAILITLGAGVCAVVNKRCILKGMSPLSFKGTNCIGGNSMKKKKVYVVQHSHWDREWYFTIEDSNLLLVENMDHLIEVMEHDPEYKGYVFDAQASILDEYLKIRPEQKERLAALIK